MTVAFRFHMHDTVPWGEYVVLHAIRCLESRHVPRHLRSHLPSVLEEEEYRRLVAHLLVRLRSLAVADPQQAVLAHVSISKRESLPVLHIEADVH
jgi:hypothetical protein